MRLTGSTPVLSKPAVRFGQQRMSAYEAQPKLEAQLARKGFSRESNPAFEIMTNQEGCFGEPYLLVFGAPDQVWDDYYAKKPGPLLKAVAALKGVEKTGEPNVFKFHGVRTEVATNGQIGPF